MLSNQKQFAKDEMTFDMNTSNHLKHCGKKLGIKSSCSCYLKTIIWGIKCKKYLKYDTYDMFSV